MLHARTHARTHARKHAYPIRHAGRMGALYCKMKDGKTFKVTQPTTASLAQSPAPSPSLT